MQVPFCSSIDLSSLPLPVLENIFSYLNSEDISRIGSTYSDLSEFATYFVRKRIHFIRVKIENLLAANKSSEKVNSLQFHNKLLSIRTYILYALRITEYGIQNEDVGLKLGRFAGCLSHYIRKLSKNQLALNDHCVHLQFQFFLKSIADFDLQENNMQFGIQIMNVLHALYYTSFHLTVIYRLKSNVCEVSGTYVLNRAKLLTYAAELPNSCQDYQISQKEQSAIIKYLVRFVAIHNILKAKEDHYFSETTNSSTANFDESNIETTREVIDMENYTVKETYARNCSTTNNKHDLRYSIYLECSPQNAPMQIKNYYNNLISNTEKEYLHAKQWNQKTANNIYKFKLQLCLSRILKGEQKNILEMMLIDGDK